MPTQHASLNTIEDFLAQKRIAIAGVSRDSGSFSMKLFEEFCRRGYDMVPVNPNAEQVEGRRCFARVQDVEPPVDTVLLMTLPEVTNTVVSDCAKAGVRRVWMYSAGVKGAVSGWAVQFCREHGMQVIPGECPYMFFPDAGGVHHFHGFVRKITGRYPRHTPS
jgi:uncharacterized protein